MLLQCTRYSQLCWGKVVALYEEDNRMLGARNYPWLEPEEQLRRAEEELRAYLREDFFPGGGVFDFWVENGVWVSGLREESYRDGILLTSLTTLPDQRRRGWGSRLVRHVRDLCPMPVYAHIHKRNTASMELHRKVGFQPCLDHAVMLDGSVLTSHCTLRY